MADNIKKFVSGAIGGAFDAAMSIYPGTAIAWGAIKGGISAVREKRAEEFILLIQNNVNLLDFNDEKFIDGLAISFENYLRQRYEFKREIIKNIFLGFVKIKNKDDFELERFYDVLNRITEKQIVIFQNIKKYNKVSIMQVVSQSVPDYNDDYDNYKYLEFLGLAGSSQEKEIKTMYDESTIKEEEFIFMTDFGNEFVKFISQ